MLEEMDEEFGISDLVNDSVVSRIKREVPFEFDYFETLAITTTLQSDCECKLFSSWCPPKGYTYLANLSWQQHVCLSMYDFLVDTRN